ncbi:Uncharacterised protein [Klebsiella pneumoniae]|nr:Uncharacterised protein [Klebsiella pneumoniae]
MTTATMWQQIHVTPRSSGAFYYQKQEKKRKRRLSTVWQILIFLRG